MASTNLSFLLSILAWFATRIVAHEAIIGGERVQDNEFLYQVSLMISNNTNRCGGGIIGDQFILTAAHCVVRMNNEFYNDSITILAGTNLLSIDKPAITVKVHKIYVPTEYDNYVSGTAGDIAVLKLDHPLNLSKNTKIKQLQLPQDNEDTTYVNEIATIAGFGWNSIKMKKGKEIGSRNDRRLRFAEADVLGPCHRKYFPLTIAKKQICARVKQTDRTQARGVCVGDSGGPLVHHDTVIGILSVSPGGCSEKHLPAIYTRVSKYKNFIETAIHDKLSPTIRTHVLR